MTREPNIRSRMTIRLQRSPRVSTVKLIGQPERWAFMRTPKTNCDIKSVDLAYNRLHNAIRTARMCRVRKGSGMAKLVFGMNQFAGRLRRPYGVCAKPHALPPLHRGGSEAGGQCLRSPNV